MTDSNVDANKSLKTLWTGEVDTNETTGQCTNNMKC